MQFGIKNSEKSRLLPYICVPCERNISLVKRNDSSRM